MKSIYLWFYCNIMYNLTAGTTNQCTLESQNFLLTEQNIIIPYLPKNVLVFCFMKYYIYSIAIYFSSQISHGSWWFYYVDKYWELKRCTRHVLLYISLILWLFFVFFTGERKICSIMCDFFVLGFWLDLRKVMTQTDY
jgi:hypothetical protein